VKTSSNLANVFSCKSIKTSEIVNFAHELIDSSLMYEFHKLVSLKRSESPEASESLKFVKGSLEAVVSKAVTKATDIYFRVLDKGKAEGQTPSTEEAEYMRLEIFKKALVQEMVKCWEQELSRLQVSGHVAHPSMIEAARKEELLNQLSPAVLKNLSSNGFAVSPGFEAAEKSYAELDRLDLLGNFKRTDLRFPLAQLCGDISIFDRAQQPACRDVAERLCALPFELNAKIGNLSLKVSSDFVFCVLKPGEKIDVHRDNGAVDNGRSVTTLVCLGSGTVFQVGDSRNAVAAGSLVLIKSRKTSWSVVNEGTSKLFVGIVFASGPAEAEW
jgi:hypothetical protein